MAARRRGLFGVPPSVNFFSSSAADALGRSPREASGVEAAAAGMEARFLRRSMRESFRRFRAAAPRAVSQAAVPATQPLPLPQNWNFFFRRLTSSVVAMAHVGAAAFLYNF